MANGTKKSWSPTDIVNLVLALGPVITALVTWLEAQFKSVPKSGAQKKAAIMAILSPCLPAEALDGVSAKVDGIIVGLNADGTFKPST